MVRYSTTTLALLVVGGLAFAASFADARQGRENMHGSLLSKQELVGELGLTDLCLFTEARYTRHLSQADLHTPFQDHPMSFDHFPSGSLVSPPNVVRGYE